MPLSIHSAAIIGRLTANPDLHNSNLRQPFPRTEDALGQFAEAIDTFYPGLDESDSDGALGEKGLVRYHTSQGERLQVRYSGDSKVGQYVQSWVGGSFMMTKFGEHTVDNYQVGPQGSHHLHLDRNDQSKSFITVAGPEHSLLPGGPIPTEPPSMPTNAGRTEGGVEFGVLQNGEGSEFADRGEAVLVHYTGWLENGTKFDSSRDKPNPFAFPLGGGRVIKGWEQGVEGMQVGEKRLLHIPANLAYGERARGAIPANSPLLFEVELLATSGQVDKIPGSASPSA